MKKYKTPKVVITTLSSGDIITVSGFIPGENETPLQPIGEFNNVTQFTS